MCYSELSTRFPNGGSAYCYVYSCFGELPAFVIAWSLVLEYTLFIAVSVKCLVGYIVHFLATAMVTLPDQLSSLYLTFTSATLVLILSTLLTKNLKVSNDMVNVIICNCN